MERGLLPNLPTTLRELNTDAIKGSPLHSYLQAVYRERLPTRIVGGARGFVWFYHTPTWIPGCRMQITRHFDRSKACSDNTTVSQVIVMHYFPPNRLVNLNRYGYWLPSQSHETCQKDAWNQSNSNQSTGARKNHRGGSKRLLVLIIEGERHFHECGSQSTSTQSKNAIQSTGTT